MSPSGITFELLDGAQAVAHTDDLQALRAEVYADAPYGRLEDDARFADRFRVWRRQPGFALAEARHGGFLVGYAAGMPLRPSTSWWRELTTPVPEDLTAEHPGRTFALTELLVRGSWRRQGIGGELHGLILAGRPEERATLTVLPAAAVAQAAFRAWGWRKVARTRGAEAAAPVSDVLVIALPAIKPRAEDSPWGSRLRGVPPERGVTSRQPTGQVRCVVLALGWPEPGGDADGERVAADFGEMLAEQVSGSPRVAGGGGADHLPVTPQHVNQPVGADGLSPLQRQQSQQGPLLGAADQHLSGRSHGLELAEQPYLHDLTIGPASASRQYRLSRRAQTDVQKNQPGRRKESTIPLSHITRKDRERTSS